MRGGAERGIDNEQGRRVGARQQVTGLQIGGCRLRTCRDFDSGWVAIGGRALLSRGRALSTLSWACRDQWLGAHLVLGLSVVNTVDGGLAVAVAVVEGRRSVRKAGAVGVVWEGLLMFGAGAAVGVGEDEVGRGAAASDIRGGAGG
ncbi:hypothetical protein TIFTF001_035718 [Ficus carica]|uniref:Uncharacterized protein n=1 Tax=Ficus carica TaxID=3494 RepID=A0AA88E3W4_FICCA|nr:hypothetical protein TIFTF001_035718 [Ficus carica]